MHHVVVEDLHASPCQWGSSITQDIHLTERIALQFPWEVFNLLNRAHFGAPR
jgi:hypothetical protein